MPQKASPPSSTSIGNLLGDIFLFTTWYVFCLERLVWFEYLPVSLPQSSLLYTPFERVTHDSEIIRILYVLHLYLLSYIVFALVLHLYLLEHGGGFVLKKLLISHASLKLFWESLNSMVICLIIICLVFKICETFFWVCWILRKDWSMIIVLRYGGEVIILKSC